jgi:hypothetical protein
MLRGVGRIAVGVLTSALVLGSPAARAQNLTVEGSVTGTLTRGSTVSFRLTATHPDGWRSLDSATVILSLRGAPLEEIVYEVDQTSISAGPATALAGTGDDITGRFFRVRALDVRTTTGGDSLGLSFKARLLEDIPPGARFEFVVEDDEGAEASVGRVAAVPEEEGGFPWGTVAGAVLVALLAGGFLGARLSAHRRPASVYATVARRLADQDRPRGRSR